VDRELEMIHGEMEETRANLANKLEALETQVRETVSGASEAVTSTVEGVKEVVETVSDTVGSVTETFNIPKQIEEHPWPAVGIAIATGFFAAHLLGGSRHVVVPAPAPAPQPQPQPEHQPASAPPPQQAAASDHTGGILPSLESLLPDMSGVMDTALKGVSSLAIGTLMGVVREVAANGLPQEWKGELTKLIDQLTTQMGGKTLQPVKQENKHEEDRIQPAPAHDRLARLEDLPSPLPPHQQNATPAQSGGESGPRSKRGGRPQTSRQT